MMMMKMVKMGMKKQCRCVSDVVGKIAHVFVKAIMYELKEGVLLRTGRGIYDRCVVLCVGSEVISAVGWFQALLMLYEVAAVLEVVVVVVVVM